MQFRNTFNNTSHLITQSFTKKKEANASFFYLVSYLKTILPISGKWFSQSEVILSPLNYGEVISPTGTVKGTPLTVQFSGCALALIRCGSNCGYHNSTASQMPKSNCRAAVHKMNEITIFSYTTKQAVEDGELIKIDSEILSEIGIKFPVYLTSVVYRRYVEVPADARDFQDLDGRLFDLLYMFALVAKQTDAASLRFKFVCLLRQDTTCQDNECISVDLSRFHKEITLKAVITAQDIDDANPAIFIMLPSED